MANQSAHVIGEPHSYWYSFYVQRPLVRKSSFAMLQCRKTTVNVSFRVNLHTFNDECKVRKVARFFFPRGTERRIKMTTGNREADISLKARIYGNTKSEQKKIIRFAENQSG